MKITKQVLKKMIKEELKQVQTNELEMKRAIGQRPAADASRVKKKRDANPGLTKAYEMINTLPEFLQVLRDLVDDVDNVRPADLVKAVRKVLSDLTKGA